MLRFLASSVIHFPLLFCVFTQDQPLGLLTPTPASMFLHAFACAVSSVRNILLSHFTQVSAQLASPQKGFLQPLYLKQDPPVALCPLTPLAFKLIYLLPTV